MIGKLMGLAALVVALSACKQSDRGDSEEEPEVVDVEAERKALVARLNESYQDEGDARIEGDRLVVTSAQCRDPRTAAAVVDFARKAARKAKITDVRCEKPPGPGKKEVVERFNQEFSDIGARAEIAGQRGRALHLMTDECSAPKPALALLEQAADLSRRAGFELVRCGKKGGKMFELDLRLRTGSPGSDTESETDTGD